MGLIAYFHKAIAIFYILLQHTVNSDLSAKSQAADSPLVKNNGFRESIECQVFCQKNTLLQMQILIVG